MRINRPNRPNRPARIRRRRPTADTLAVNPMLTTPMLVGGLELGPLVHVHPATVDRGE